MLNNTFQDLREKDNLSTVDKMAGPNVPLILRSEVLLANLINTSQVEKRNSDIKG